MTTGIKLVLTLLVLAGVSWAAYECKYYYSYYADLKERPWAYSPDPTSKLLVGTWQGAFRDPDNVAKTIRLEIRPPVSDEERAQKAGRRTRKRSGLGSRTDKKRFEGIATIRSQRGEEDYQITGHVKTEEGHQLDAIHFQPEDEAKKLRNNFNVVSALEGGQWQSDELTLILAFTFTTATGSSYSSSNDPRYGKKVTVQFSRIQQ